MRQDEELALDSDLRELTYSVPLGRTGRNIQDHRDRLAQLKPVIKPDETVSKLDLFLPVTQTRKIPVLIYRPKNNPYADKRPTLIYVAGTAFVAYEKAYTDVACTHIAAKTGCQVIVIHHRLAPEETFPAQTDDVAQASEFLFTNPQKFKIDLDRIATLGYSTGGTFIAQLGAMAHQNKWPISLQILVSPILDLARTVTQFRKFETQDTVISDDFVKWFFKLYIPEGISPDDPRISPFHITELEKMPPTSIIVGQFDRFRGDAEEFALRLGDNCISRFVCPKQNHGFFWNRAEALELVATQIKTTFGFFSPLPNIDIDSTGGERQGSSCVVATHTVSVVDGSMVPAVSTLSLDVHADGGTTVRSSSRESTPKPEEPGVPRQGLAAKPDLNGTAPYTS